MLQPDNRPKECSLMALPLSIAGQDVQFSIVKESIMNEIIKKKSKPRYRTDISCGKNQPASWKELMNEAYESQLNDNPIQVKFLKPLKYSSSFVLDESTQHKAGRNILEKILIELEDISWKGWGNPFNVEVSPQTMPPDYFIIIKKPISLIDIRTKYTIDETYNFRLFNQDITLMIKNALKFNREGEDVYGMALNLRAKYDALITEHFGINPETETESVTSTTKPKKRARSPMKPEKNKI
mmetsp:Transcript_3905/g.5159  ORF Transcript_3905/g.5159 Transcript_3905/m.5159 type:complete len:240 (+) Transcript_3905:66-785(+)